MDVQVLEPARLAVGAVLLNACDPVAVVGQCVGCNDRVAGRRERDAPAPEPRAARPVRRVLGVFPVPRDRVVGDRRARTDLDENSFVPIMRRLFHATALVPAVDVARCVGVVREVVVIDLRSINQPAVRAATTTNAQTAVVVVAPTAND